MSVTQPYLDKNPGDGVRNPVRKHPLYTRTGALPNAIARKLWLARAPPNQLSSQIKSAVRHISKREPSFSAMFGSGKRKKKGDEKMRSLKMMA